MEQQADIKEMFLLIRELVKVLRVFQNEKTICEEITFSQFCIIDHIKEKGTLPLSELHELLAVEKSTTTRLVNPLVEKKLIDRTRCSCDSRAIILTVTPQGEQVHAKMWNCMSCFTTKMLEHIPEGDKNTVKRSVKLFIDCFAFYNK